MRSSADEVASPGFAHPCRDSEAVLNRGRDSERGDRRPQPSVRGRGLGSRRLGARPGVGITEETG